MRRTPPSSHPTLPVPRRPRDPLGVAWYASARVLALFAQASRHPSALPPIEVHTRVLRALVDACLGIEADLATRAAARRPRLRLVTRP